jgi:hypothetical protein
MSTNHQDKRVEEKKRGHERYLGITWLEFVGI